MRTDKQIRDEVLEEIDWDPRVKSTEIGVTVKDGAVTLTGTVRTYGEKAAAEQAASRVKGVKAIAENIEVVLPSAAVRTDETIAERIAGILKWNSVISSCDIKGEVRAGRVTLTGSVDWNFQRETAARLVADIEGVKSVANHIHLKSQVQPADVKKAITRALHRMADLDASTISVDVDGHKVTLHGKVRAWSERSAAEEAAWAAPGVTAVIDNIQLQ